MKPLVDVSAAPLVQVTFFDEITIEEGVAHFDEIATVALEAGPVAIIVDLTRARFFSSHVRSRAAQEMQRVFERAGHRIVGVAHVVPSLPVRGALTVIQWLAPPPFPSFVSLTHPPALRWARERLAEAGRATASTSR